MNADITLLQNQAAQAVPSWSKGKPGPVGRWSPLWPVYAELRRQGFTIREAIEWLIREGAVPAGDRKKAEYGLPMVDSRRRREEALARGEKPARRTRRKKAGKTAAAAKPTPKSSARGRAHQRQASTT
jgi:hypothetical protein